MISIDRVVPFDYPCRELAIVGWCCFDDHTLPEESDEVWVKVAGQEAPCYLGVPRPDVALSLKAPALDRAGFFCRVPVPEAGAEIVLVARRNGDEREIDRFVPTWTDADATPGSGITDYDTWLRQCEAALHWRPDDVQRQVRSLPHQPVVSVIVPTYNTHLYHLHRCIDSVVRQRYGRWELCITDDNSSDPRVREYLQRRAATEPRIRLQFGDRQGGISRASNQSIEQATGEFIVLLDHDDELHPAALLEVVRCLNAQPDTDLIYSDEDKIDQLGVRCYPSFKPRFDDDLVRGFDYLGHLVALRTALVRTLGGFRPEADGAQDWDLLLRLIASIDRRRIRHIAKPLYHWRMHQDSTALSLDAKPYAVRAWRSVLTRDLANEACGIGDGLFLGSMRIVRTLSPDCRISIVYRASDGPHQRRALNRSRLPRETGFYELLLTALRPVDAPASAPLMTPADLASDVTIVVNAKLESVNHHFLEELAAQAMRADCGIVGGTMLDAHGAVLTAGLVCLDDGTFVNPFAGMSLHDPGYMGQAQVVRRVATIAPHIFAFRTARLQDANGLTLLGEDSLTRLCETLVSSAHAQDLKVLHTPYAVATLRSTSPYVPRQGQRPPQELLLNPNLQRFADVSAILKAGLS
jgi:O-antigen biosynthesis protein